MRKINVFFFAKLVQAKIADLSGFDRFHSADSSVLVKSIYVLIFLDFFLSGNSYC